MQSFQDNLERCNTIPNDMPADAATEKKLHVESFDKAYKNKLSEKSTYWKTLQKLAKKL